MRRPPHRKARPLRRASSARVALAALAASLLAPPAAADDVDLIGTWYVLIHYRDANSAHPESDRWDDRIWRFEQKGSRLQWTEYPIVVFQDQTGRFERLATSRASRVVHAWQPNAAQRYEIERGLRVNPRGSRTKSLRGSPERGYSSTGSLRTRSAGVLGYHEAWKIESPSTLPVFLREDSLGNSARKSLEGVTRYATTEVGKDGRLRGTFNRDESRAGRFQMFRAGEARSVGTTRSQGERVLEHLLGGAQPEEADGEEE